MKLRLGLLPVSALLALAPAAQAATRYATPAGGGSQPCAAATPCSLTVAVQAAQSGDDVAVAPGDYAVSATIKPRSGVALHGSAGQPRPQLLGTPQLGADVLQLQSGDTATHLAVQAGDRGHAAVTARAAAVADLVVVANGADSGVVLVTDRAGTGLAGSLVECHGCADGAVVLQDGESGGSASVVAVTALADGAAPAIFSRSNSDSLTLVDTVASGTGLDIDASAGHGTPQVSFSAFRPDDARNVADAGGNVASAVFADGDGHESGRSPTIDAGTPDPRAGATDLDGNPRTLGAATDIGAYERAPDPAPGSSGSPGRSGALDAPWPAGGSSTGGAARLGDSPADLAPVGTPKAGRSVAVGTASGTVLVRSPDGGAFVALGPGQQLPLGGEIDARDGVVRLTSAADAKGTPQTGVFTGSRFRVTQTGGPRPITRLQLTGGSFASCRASARAAKSGVRSLWGRDKGGRFQTRGRTAAATVRGTRWLTEDSCQGTRVAVAEGAVSVHDDARRRDVVVRAGHSYLARAQSRQSAHRATARSMLARPAIAR